MNKPTLFDFTVPSSEYTVEMAKELVHRVLKDELAKGNTVEAFGHTFKSGCHMVGYYDDSYLKVDDREIIYYSFYQGD